MGFGLRVLALVKGRCLVTDLWATTGRKGRWLVNIKGWQMVKGRWLVNIIHRACFFHSNG